MSNILTKGKFKHWQQRLFFFPHMNQDVSQMFTCKPVPCGHILTGLYSSMRSSCSGVHLSNTGSRISNGTPPVSHSTEEKALVFRMNLGLKD